MSVTYFKALQSGRRATHVDGFVWPEPGTWLEVDGALVACSNGLHVATVEHLLEWLSDEVWVVEVDETAGLVDAGDKVVVRRARLVERTAWDERTARLFAADCAERVLHLFEAERPGDDRPRRAIAAARAYARGDIDDAARAAAWDAARAAAWDAARAAAWAAARAAARAAAWDAARAAAWDAARAAARAAERAWQTERLAQYLRGEVS